MSTPSRIKLLRTEASREEPRGMSAADRIERCYRIAGALFVQFVYDARLQEPLQADWKPARPEQLKGMARRRYEVARGEFARLIAENYGGASKLVILDTFDMTDEVAADLKLRFARPAGSA